MPIQYGSYTKQMKLLPLFLAEDGSATCSARFGYVGVDNVFNAVDAKTFQFDAAVVSSILDTTPTAGLTRRDDLSLAIYTYLVTHGLVEAGTIS